MDDPLANMTKQNSVLKFVEYGSNSSECIMYNYSIWFLLLLNCMVTSLMQKLLEVAWHVLTLVAHNVVLKLFKYNPTKKQNLLHSTKTYESNFEDIKLPTHVFFQVLKCLHRSFFFQIISFKLFEWINIEILFS